MEFVQTGDFDVDFVKTPAPIDLREYSRVVAVQIPPKLGVHSKTYRSFTSEHLSTVFLYRRKLSVDKRKAQSEPGKIQGNVQTDGSREIQGNVQAERARGKSYRIVC